MALFLLGPDSEGTCCECSQRTSPCDTCVQITLECQSDSKFASFIGRLGYLNSPAIYFKKESYNISNQCCTYTNSLICDTNHLNFTSRIVSIIAGYITHLGGSTTNTITNHQVLFCDGCNDTNCIDIGSDPSEPGICSSAIYAIASNTEKSYSYPSGCVDSKQSRGSGTYTLSEQDTEQDALDRATPTGWVNGGCSDKNLIPSGSTFERVKARWRINRSGYSPSTAYDVTVKYYRSDILYQTVTYVITSNSSGDLVSSYVEVPSQRGYITYVDSTDVTISPSV